MKTILAIIAITLGAMLLVQETADAKLKVAVIDSGFNGLHPKTRDIPLCKDGHANLLTNRNDLGFDEMGHGTVVTKLISDNAQRKDLCFLIFKVFGQGSTTDEMIAKAIRLAVQRGAKVINMSLGGPGYSVSMYKALKFAERNRVAVFVAAGNDSDNLNNKCNSYPACYKIRGMRVVGALDYNYNIVDYSNFGLQVTRWEDGYAYGMQGTSFASPRAAGRYLNETK